MSGSTNISHLLANLEPTLHEGEFVICSRPHHSAVPHLALGTFREDEATTFYLPRTVAIDLNIAFEFSWALITLNIHSSLAAVGFLATITQALAARDISVNAVSAFYHDHLFVPYGRRQEALEILKSFQSDSLPNAVIFHGTKGNPDAHWFPWLAEKLSARGYQVTRPSFSTPSNQSLDQWLSVWEALGLELNSDSVLIGHSLGATFILHLLERIMTPIAGAFLVASVSDLIQIPEYDLLNQSFLKSNFNWQLIGKNARHLEIIHGSADPYVPITHALALSRNLSLPLTVLPDAQHLNSEDGFVTFDYLDQQIRLTCA